MIRLGIITPNATDACSWYRTFGPLTQLSKEIEIDLFHPPKLDWVEAGKMDVCYMQRPYAPEHETAAMILRKAGVPLWVDFDDNLWDVPTWNQAHKHFANEQCQRVLRNVCASAHTISVTTPALAEYIYARTAKIPAIVPNTLQDRFPLKPPTEGKPLVWWRGGKQHKRDHLVVGEMMRAIAEADKEARFLAFGDDPHWTEDPVFSGRLEVVTDALDILFYHEELYRRSPGLLLYGLDDCEFNKSKSTCSWLEATMCGSTVVGPDWVHWKLPGVYPYKAGDTADACRAAVEAYLHGNRGEAWRLSADHLNYHYRTSQANSTRKQIIQSMLASVNKRL